MEFSLNVEGAGTNTGRGYTFEEDVKTIVEAEKMGVDSVWGGEAWGADAIVPLAYIAAHTTKIKLGTAIMQVTARRPSMTAMTAMTMAAISGNRFILGLGMSGPQVVEGLHGESFEKPLTRMRECIEIIRLAFAGEKVEYHGEHYVMPRPGGEGKALRVVQQSESNIPICLATLGPKALEMTGELADGWLGTCFDPDAANVYFDPMRKGAERAGRNFDDFILRVPVIAGISDNPEPMIENRRKSLAFQLGGMGSPNTNFYNNAYRRIGYEDIAVEVQRLWAEGKRDEATKKVSDDMILNTTLIGTEDMVRERVKKYRSSGLTVMGLQPFGHSREEKLELVSKIMSMVKEA